MQHILRCDYEACRQYLVNLEQAFLLDQGSQTLGALLDHRCDGNRNVLHAAVSVCFPVSNKETKEEEGRFTFRHFGDLFTQASSHETFFFRTEKHFFVMVSINRADFLLLDLLSTIVSHFHLMYCFYFRS